MLTQVLLTLFSMGWGGDKGSVALPDAKRGELICIIIHTRILSYQWGNLYLERPSNFLKIIPLLTLLGTFYSKAHVLLTLHFNFTDKKVIAIGKSSSLFSPANNM